MRLSMWILNDWLKKYRPEPRIVTGDQVLRSARILSSDIEIERQNVYLARASEFISGEEDRIICVQGQDMILLSADDMNEVLNDIFDAFDFYNSWADGISADILNGCTLQDLVDKSGPVFKQPLLIYNSGNEIVGLSSGYPKGSLDSEWDTILETRTNSMEFLLKLREELVLQKTRHDTARYAVAGSMYSSVYKSIFSDRAWVGRLLLLETDHTLSIGERQLFETLASLVERWIQSSDRKVQMREETAIFKDLLEGRPVSKEELSHKLQMTGWEDDHRKQLIRIEVPQANSEICRAMIQRMERAFPDSYCIDGQDVICLLADLSLTSEAEIRKKLKPLLKQGRLCAVASYTFTDVRLLSDYHEQCILTFRYIPRKSGEIYCCEDFALDCIHAFIRKEVPKVLKAPALDRLLAYDRENNGDLYHTLYCYLRANCNMAETARTLHLHRNSLLYRLNQIRDLSGISLDNEDTREHLLLSYYM